MNAKTSAAAAIALALASNAHAEVVVGSYDVVLSAGNYGVFDTMGVNFGMVPDLNFFEPVLMTETSTVSTAQIGATWTSEPASMPAVLALLQDGDASDAFGVFAIVGDPEEPNTIFTGVVESDFAAVGLDREDVASLTDFVRITMTDLSFSSPGDDPNGDGIWTNFSGVFQFEFVSVPTPGGAAMLGLASLAGARRRRRA